MQRPERSPDPSFFAIFCAAIALVTGTACGGSRATAQVLDVSVGRVTSSTVELSWPRVRDAQRVRVYVGAEPGETPTALLPDALLFKQLEGDADGCKVGPLAAGVDAFIRVEADTPRGSQGFNVHVRTLGGPRAELDTAVREVHAVAPNILEIVLANGDAEEWASNAWRIRRRNNAAVRVTRVFRHSVPVGQPNYEIGFDARDDIQEVDVDHRIFLQLAAPIGNRDVLRVEGPKDVELILPFSDRYLETTVIQVNQVGYNPRARARYAYVYGYLGSGGVLALDRFPATSQVLREATNALAPRTVVTDMLPIRTRIASDPDVGGQVREIDLSSVPAAEGVRYRVRVPGVGVSWPTQVSELAAFKAFYVTARGLYHNRWGAALDRRYTEWSRPMSHGVIFQGSGANAFSFIAESTSRSGRQRLNGGYHDAGDFDQRPTHTVVPQLLMRAYEQHPTHFLDGQLSIPESNNRIPDLLDEALWGVAAWEQLQDRDGGVRAGVESHRHPAGIYFANEDPLPYWTFAADAKVTARAAGVFAQASRLLAPFDPRRATRLRDRAERAFAWAKAHGAGGPFLLYGASELYLLTNARTYREAFETIWRSFGSEGCFRLYALEHNALGDYQRTGRCMPDYFLGYMHQQERDPVIDEQVGRWVTRSADAAAQQILESRHGHRSAHIPGRPVSWGMGTVMGRYADPIIARMQLGGLDEHRRQTYFDALSVAADYVLGANPLGMTFITGLGSRPPREPLHLDSLAFIKRGQGPIPGIPVYGPIDNLPGQPWYRPAASKFFPAFGEQPRLLRYADVRTFVNTNEFTVWENQAPHAEHFSVLIGPGMRPPERWLAGKPDHRSSLP